MADATDLKTTPLHKLHGELGAKMVPFAGYDMPVQYPLGVLNEHLHTRAKAGLFDVSHMGQANLRARGQTDAVELMEQLTPGGLMSLKEGGIRYTQLTDESAGILDDLMVTRFGPDAWLVVNAACKNADFEHIQARLDGLAELQIADRALLALQGPQAEAVLAKHMPACTQLRFMQAVWSSWNATPVLVSRCGYTGEDGFEISLEPDAADAFARALLADPAVEPIGLGARDSLRLEAGLCLYGHDIDTDTTPVEADLMWSVPKRRREQGGFPGADRVNQQLADGPQKRRVGILPEGRAPAREGTDIHNKQGDKIGTVTSGGFGPSVGGPVAMGYVAANHADIDTPVDLMVRGKPLPAKIVALPFVEQRYAKGAS